MAAGPIERFIGKTLAVGDATFEPARFRGCVHVE
jgi:hypothetical protein